MIMTMLRRYASEKSKERIVQIYELRMKGSPLQEIASRFDMSLPNVQQAFYRECRFRKKAFDYPFVEFIGPRTLSVIRKCLGEEILATPDDLRTMENVRALICWPGVGAKTINDLINGLVAAGYPGFDYDLIYNKIFKPRTPQQTTIQ